MKRADYLRVLPLIENIEKDNIWSIKKHGNNSECSSFKKRNL